MCLRIFAAIAASSVLLAVASCGEKPSFQNQTVPTTPSSQSQINGSGDSQADDHKGSVRIPADVNADATAAIPAATPAAVAAAPTPFPVGAGNPSVAPASTPSPVAVVSASPQPIVIPVDCDEHGATQAVLLTSSLTNGGVGGTIQYRIFRTDCEGNVLKLTADKIWFDIDAIVTSFVDINYTLATDAKTDSGIMKDINGSDLFGNTGPNWGHWETQKSVSVTSSTRYVTLSISLPTQHFRPRTGPANMLSTYLKFGDAAAVEKVIPLK